MQKETKKYIYNLRIPRSMIDEIRQLADKDGISINAVIIQMVARSIRENEK